MLTMHSAVTTLNGKPQASGEFFNKLPQEAQNDLQSVSHQSSFPSGRVLFTEKDPVSSVYIVLEGEVKLSMNSPEGKRLILHIAKKGEVLGLASALSGRPCEMTAETQIGRASCRERV